jgi:hygromycin-B 7''-O-kinase
MEMPMPGPEYTEREWNHLVRQGDPEGYHDVSDDLAYWKPKVEAVLARHGLPIHGELWMGEETNVVFFTDDLVVKLFTQRSPVWFPREVEVLRLLGGEPRARTPRLRGHGDAISDDHPELRYLIMARLPGEPLAGIYETLAVEQKCALAEQMAEIAQAIHAAPVAGLRSFGTSPREWVERIRARAAVWEEDRASDLPPYLAAQVPRFLEENLPLVTEEFRPTLLSADLHGWHILVARQEGVWRITGLIDLGDAEVGPVEYEWVPLCQNAFRGEEPVMRAFFAAYGWPLPVSPAVKQRLKLYTLLHRYPPFRSPPTEVTEGPSLEAILEEQWPL